MSATLKPLHDRIIVRQRKEAEVSKGGIFIPTTAQEKPMEGEVLAIGTGKVSDNGIVIPVSVKVGEIILFAKHSYQEIKRDGEEYLIIRDENILAVIDPT